MSHSMCTSNLDILDQYLLKQVEKLHIYFHISRYNNYVLRIINSITCATAAKSYEGNSED